jgi:hypothetical protein
MSTLCPSHVISCAVACFGPLNEDEWRASERLGGWCAADSQCLKLQFKHSDYKCRLRLNESEAGFLCLEGASQSDMCCLTQGTKTAYRYERMQYGLTKPNVAKSRTCRRCEWTEVRVAGASWKRWLIQRTLGKYFSTYSDWRNKTGNTSQVQNLQE